jgi:uncharacterized membrane protein YecN with MAPEG domain
MLRLEYAALYAGVNLIILVVVAYLVIRLRRRHKISLGDGGNEALQRAIRAHANAAEYIPAGLAGLTLLSLMEPAAPVWLLHAAGISLTLGRILHPIGIYNGSMLFRGPGMQLTFLSYVLMAGGLIYAGLAQQL